MAGVFNSMWSWLSYTDSSTGDWTTQPPISSHWFPLWSSRWDYAESGTTFSPGSSIQTISWWSWSNGERDNDDDESHTTVPSVARYPSDDKNMNPEVDNYLMVQFLAHYTYHRSLLRTMMNPIVQCPGSEGLSRFADEFTRRASVCQKYFDITFDTAVFGHNVSGFKLSV